MRTQISLVLALCFICSSPLQAAGQCPVPHTPKAIATLFLAAGMALMSVVPQPYKRPVAVATALALGGITIRWFYNDVLPQPIEENEPLRK